MSTLLKVVSLLACFVRVDVFFRVTCAPFKRERIDPLVNPNAVSSHIHTFFGARNIGPAPLMSGSLQSGCTSCDNQLKKSSYWIPTLNYGMESPRSVVAELLLLHKLLV
jgi:hypothetical protein